MMDKIPRSLHNPGPAVMGEANTVFIQFYFSSTQEENSIMMEHQT